EGADTGYCMVLVEPTAERSFVTVYGAERQITADSLATLDAQPGDLLCLSGYSLFEPTRRPLLEYLESLPDGVEVVLDPGAPFAGFPQQSRIGCSPAPRCGPPIPRRPGPSPVWTPCRTPPRRCAAGSAPTPWWWCATGCAAAPSSITGAAPRSP